MSSLHSQTIGRIPPLLSGGLMLLFNRRKLSRTLHLDSPT